MVVEPLPVLRILSSYY